MSDEVSALGARSPAASPGLTTMNESSHSQGTPAYLGSLIPPLFPLPSLSEMTRALRPTCLGLDFGLRGRGTVTLCAAKINRFAVPVADLGVSVVMLMGVASPAPRDLN